MKNKLINTFALLVFFLTAFAGTALAQIKNPPIDGKNLTPAGQAELGHLVWYKEPWVWIVAALAILLVIVMTRKVRVSDSDEKEAHSHSDRRLAD